MVWSGHLQPFLGFGSGGLVVARKPGDFGTSGPYRPDAQEIICLSSGQSLIQQWHDGLLIAACPNECQRYQWPNPVQGAEIRPGEDVLGGRSCASPLAAIHVDARSS